VGAERTLVQVAFAIPVCTKQKKSAKVAQYTKRKAHHSLRGQYWSFPVCQFNLRQSL
jgi:hypothetical protein